MDYVSRSALNNPKYFQNQAKLDHIYVMSSPFTGPTTYMQQLFPDTIATVRKYGGPYTLETMGPFLVSVYSKTMGTDKKQTS